MVTGDALSTGGKEAHGDLTGVGGAGGFATSVGFSGAPFKTKPLPDGSPPVLTPVGAGDFGFSLASLSLDSEDRWTVGEG